MGKIQLHTKGQELILNEIKKNEFLKNQFCFTGGTALSAVYLHHRYSDDLDFFSLNKFETQAIFTMISEWADQHHFTFTANFAEVVYIFLLTFQDGSELKVDFSYYPYKKLEKEHLIDNILVDSLMDIAVNKLLTITQRTEVKDFADLYFLLEKFSVWDLMHGVKQKFKVELDPLIVAADFLKAESFDYMPRMISPLTMNQLQSFFQQKARDLGLKTIA